MVADSLDGVWNNSPSIGAGLGVGLLLGILSSGSGSTEYVERVNTSPSTENFITLRMKSDCSMTL